MRKALAAVTLFLVPGFAFAAPSKFGLEVSLMPGGATGIYVCEAQIKDLDSDEVVSAPRIVWKAGDPATASTRSGDLLSVLKVSVDPATSTGTAELTVSKRGKLVASQKSQLRLK